MSAPIVVVGAGPAGMTLAYQLAASGLPVRVLERHKNFDREFRGEFAQPSAVDVMTRLGVLDELRAAERTVRIRAVRMYRGARPFATSGGDAGGDAGLVVHQPSFLSALDARSARYPSYTLERGVPVTGLVHEGPRVTGVVVRRGGVEERVPSSLVVVCNGRNSPLRRAAGAENQELERPSNLLWLRFDVTNAPELYPETLDGFLTPRAFAVLYPTYARRVQLMWRRSRRHVLDWKADVATLRDELRADLPAHWRTLADRLTADTERQVLHVVCDRLRRWWSPGILFLGDAAHTMSPIGGQGLTIAIRDAVVAANHLIDAHRRDAPLDDELLARIEAERRPEVEPMQAFQVRAGRINDAPAAAQWLLARAVIPLATRLQGASYLRSLQHGVTEVAMRFPPGEPPSRYDP